MTNREKRFFNIARQVSFLSDYKKARVGAIVVINNHIIGSGFSSIKTRPLQHKYNFYRGFDDYKDSIACQHAEIDALSPLIGKDINWKKTSIFVYRELKNGTRTCSRPCVACMTLIKKLGIKNIYFIDENGQYCKEKSI